ncbi:AmmeMemoRadiSam system protein B [Hydrogenobaculum acidophilum]
MIREEAVAGLFYPEKKETLLKAINLVCENEVIQDVDAKGAIVPHAGYIYSGHTACSVYKKLKPKKNVIMMGPNHTGQGPVISIDSADSWKTPLGEVKVNKDLRDKVASFGIEIEHNAHIKEHALEVQLPFLQVYFKDFTIVPIILGFLDYETIVKFGRFLSSFVDENTFILVSSDMSHYISQEEAQKKDSFLYDAIVNLDSKELYRRAIQYNITMCGFIPAAVAIEALKDKVKKVYAVEYTNSGMVTKDFSKVVAYLGVIFE